MGVKVVLMAGGQGERFWPYSRPWLPKQFISLYGTRTLLQEAYRRACRYRGLSDVFVATQVKYAAIVREQLPALPVSNLILEPEPRDTAPALALAALVLEHHDPTAVMVALPSDHVITGEDLFIQSLEEVVTAARETEGLVTLGVPPCRPETGYGYIHAGDPAGDLNGCTIYRVRRFVEKPDRAIARRYLESGEYFWNSGMFAWQLPVLRREMAKHLPEFLASLDELSRVENLSALIACSPSIFKRMPKISIDYGLIEKSDQVFMVPAKFGWDDVGTWSALERIRKRDGQGNAVRGKAVLHDAHNLVVESISGRVIAAVGISDLVIVDSGDAVLVCHLDRTQDVKAVAAKADDLAGRAFRLSEAASGKLAAKL